MPATVAVITSPPTTSARSGPAPSIAKSQTIASAAHRVSRSQKSIPIQMVAGQQMKRARRGARARSNFLINKILNIEERIIDEKLVNFTILEKDNKINIFFDRETYELIGWQNTDIYQNFNITYLSSIRKNKILSKNLFKIPTQN